jgi:hypothetical protein
VKIQGTFISLSKRSELGESIKSIFWIKLLKFVYVLIYMNVYKLKILLIYESIKFQFFVFLHFYQKINYVGT